MRLRVTVEDTTTGHVLAVIGIDSPDDKGVCRVDLAERGGARYSGFFPDKRGGKRSWLYQLRLALRSIK